MYLCYLFMNRIYYSAFFIYIKTIIKIPHESFLRWDVKKISSVLSKTRERIM